MRVQVKQFTDDFKLKVVQEYLETSISGKDLMNKYQIRGHGCINNWIRKFGLTKPDQTQIDIQRTMKEESAKTAKERVLELKVKQLEKELDNEKLRTLALNTMIDIAERDLHIPIRKKSGAKR
jgi:transposase-like protein